MKLDELDGKFIALGEGDKQFPARAAVAYFLSAIMPVDGETHPMEVTRLLRIVSDDFDMTNEETRELVDHVGKQRANSVNMQAMADVLMAELSRKELLLLISHLWEMVLADGRIHEAEIVFVERVANLLDIPQDEVAVAMNADGT